MDSLNPSAVDSVAPKTPTGLRALAQAAAVDLRWAPSLEADVASYTVLRADGASGPFDTIARGVKSSTFRDGKVSGGRKYLYKVKAVDRSLNSSAFSAAVDATPRAMAAN